MTLGQDKMSESSVASLGWFCSLLKLRIDTILAATAGWQRHRVLERTKRQSRVSIMC